MSRAGTETEGPRREGFAKGCRGHQETCTGAVQGAGETHRGAEVEEWNSESTGRTEHRGSLPNRSVSHHPKPFLKIHK